MDIYILAATYGGLREATGVLADGGTTRVAENIRDFVLSKGVGDRHLVKHVRSRDVDSSLIGVAVPYGLLDPQDGLMHSTVARIEKDLRPHSGGLRPYVADTYYGGAEWIPTTASLGWYYAEIGGRGAAAQLLAWVASQADDQGLLPEQVSHSLNAPEMYASWVERWGPSPGPSCGPTLST